MLISSKIIQNYSSVLNIQIWKYENFESFSNAVWMSSTNEECEEEMELH